MFATPPLEKLLECIANPSSPIGARMRAVYFLRQAHDNSYQEEESDSTSTTATTTTTADIESSSSSSSSPSKLSPSELRSLIITSLTSQLHMSNHGALLLHEIAYCLGQMRNQLAVKSLCDLLDNKTLTDKNETNDDMVRHEAAEGLAAIGKGKDETIETSEQVTQEIIACLERNANNDDGINTNSFEVRETCQIGLDFLKWQTTSESQNENDINLPVCACILSPYNAHDPAPAHPSHEALQTKEIGDLLRDETQPLFLRYRAMFSLRNRGGEEAAIELGKSLSFDKNSALLRHEIAYVLGQMQEVKSVPFLVEVLRRGKEGEHSMVRHEAAEALGAIEEVSGECEEVLKEFINDDCLVVSESCLVALDAIDYFSNPKSSEDEDDSQVELEALELAEKEEKKTAMSFKSAKEMGGGVGHFNVVKG